MQALESSEITHCNIEQPSTIGLRVFEELDLNEEPLHLPPSTFLYGQMSIENGTAVNVSFTRENENFIASMSLSKKKEYKIWPNRKANAGLSHCDITSSVLVLRADGDNSCVIQVYNAANKKKLGEHLFDEPVVFWCWMSPKFLAVITSSMIYHWVIDTDMPEPTSPVEAFKRAGALVEKDVQILSYRTDTNDPATVKWSLLSTICQGAIPGTVDGHMQLYNHGRQMQQFLDGHVGTIGLTREALQDEPTVMIAFVEKIPGESTTKLHIIDLADSVLSTRKENLRKNSAEFKIPNIDTEYDFVIGLEFSLKDGLVYGVTKRGSVMVFDAITGTHYLTEKFSNDGIFGVGFNQERQCVVACSRGGRVYSFQAADDAVIDAIKNYTSPVYVDDISNLAARGGYSVADSTNSHLFDALINAHDHAGAARIMGGLRSGILRQPQFIESLVQSSSLMARHLVELLPGRLDQSECMVIVRSLASENDVETIRNMFVMGKMCLTPSVAQVIVDTDNQDMINTIANSKNAFNEYNATELINFLIALHVQDPRTLIFLCDKENSIRLMANYLWNNNMVEFLEVYALKVNPAKFPEVLKAILEEGARDQYIRDFIGKIEDVTSVSPEQIIEVLENRQKLELAKKYLEATVSSGSTSEIIHTALIKIYIMESDSSVMKKLETNQYYDQEAIGEFCADRDPTMAFKAYTRNLNPLYDEKVLDLGLQNALYRLLANYLIVRQEPNLWKAMLSGSPSDLYDIKISEAARGELLNQVILNEIQECSEIRSVIVAVKALKDLDLHEELIELIERIIFYPSVLQDVAIKSSSLQNILLDTAIRRASTKVGEFLARLDNYNHALVAQTCIDHELYEEAITIYIKFNKPMEAINLLVKKIGDTERAENVVQEFNTLEAWLALAEMMTTELENGLHKDEPSLYMSDINRAMKAYVNAQSTDFDRIVQLAQQNAMYNDVVSFLEKYKNNPRLRTQVSLTSKVPDIVSLLIYALVYANRFDEAYALIETSNSQSLSSVGDKILEECVSGQHEDMRRVALKIFEMNGAYGKIAELHLDNDIPEAMRAASKANVPKLWTRLCLKAIETDSFDYANEAVVHILGLPDVLENIVKEYEKKGKGRMLIDTIEAHYKMPSNPTFPDGVCPTAVGTNLAFLYIRHSPDELIPFLKLDGVRSSQINKTRLVNECEACYRFDIGFEILYNFNKDYDEACLYLMKHSHQYFDHESFCKCLRNVKQANFIYRGVAFYLLYLPDKLNDLLCALDNIDSNRLISTVSKFCSNKCPSFDSMDTDHNKSTAGSSANTDEVESVPTGLILILPYLMATSGLANRLKHTRKGEMEHLENEYPLLFNQRLSTIDKGDTGAINTAANLCYLELGFKSALELSLSVFSNYEKESLAEAIAKSKHMSFKQLSALLFALSKNHTEALHALLDSGEYTGAFIPDAVAVVASAKNRKLVKQASELLRPHLTLKMLAALGATCFNIIPMSEIETMSWYLEDADDDLVYKILTPIRVYQMRQLEEALNNRLRPTSSSDMVKPRSAPMTTSNQAALQGPQDTDATWQLLNRL